MKTGRVSILVMVFLSFALVFAGCGGGGGGGSDGGDGGGPSRQWTYMVYLGADNNLSDMGIDDINEMASVGSNSNMAIVVQAEFSTYYSGSDVPSDTRRALIEAGDASSNLANSTSIGNVDMGDPATLTSFIQWAQQNYPAQHYALVIWDHGAGWKDRAPEVNSSLFRGAVQDETSGSFMSLPELAKGVSDSGVHLDIINFDACLMAMYEVAYEFKGLVDYMVFSEETEPGDGDPYDTILGELAGNPSMTARELSTVIVNKYDESYVSYVQSYPGELTTKSAIDMSQIANLDSAIMTLAQELQNDNATDAVVASAQSVTKDYAYPANHDIYDFAGYISDNTSGAAQTAANNVMTAVDSLVVANATNPDSSNADNHGIAIYIPSADETNSQELAEYSALACNQARASSAGTWGAYIDDLLSSSGGGTATYGTGDFSLMVTWETPSGGACDADLDLWVIENGNFYAPWMGQTTPNGFFSADSLISGDSMEYYQANSQVETGYYDFVVQYYDDGATCSVAEAELWYKASSSSSYALLGSAQMDLSFGYYNTNDSYSCDSIGDLYSYLVCISGYSDFLYVGYVQVQSPPLESSGLTKESRSVNIPVGKREHNTLKIGKESRLY